MTVDVTTDWFWEGNVEDALAHTLQAGMENRKSRRYLFKGERSFRALELPK
jgi:hypothetical protein